MNTAIYLGEWKDGGFISMVADFSDIYMTTAEFEAETAPYANESYWREKKAALAAALASDQFQNLTILVADYDTPPYEGDAFVLFERDGGLYEVNGGHCSCHGLEGQWEPEATTAEAMNHRLANATYGRFHDNQEFREAMRAALAKFGATQ